MLLSFNGEPPSNRRRHHQGDTKSDVSLSMKSGCFLPLFPLLLFLAIGMADNGRWKEKGNGVMDLFFVSTFAFRPSCILYACNTPLHFSFPTPIPKACTASQSCQVFLFYMCPKNIITLIFTFFTLPSKDNFPFLFAQSVREKHSLLFPLYVFHILSTLVLVAKKVPPQDEEEEKRDG